MDLFVWTYIFPKCKHYKPPHILIIARGFWDKLSFNIGFVTFETLETISDVLFVLTKIPHKINKTCYHLLVYSVYTVSTQHNIEANLLASFESKLYFDFCDNYCKLECSFSFCKIQGKWDWANLIVKQNTYHVSIVLDSLANEDNLWI